ncbi:uncharacterized protein C2845_PM02G16500 [Panicum miliaceum]|uniref:Uncharacterized protein n=1 Tax=Panicum miliaceum TaxID=4540 RepID=A0A3L6SEW6_PANMI|nr:uncharacterized protein C2845_PM02G16500 [Panicum miliaceum]
MDLAGVGLMRHCVLPPTGVDGRMTQEPLSPEDVAVVNMNSGELLSACYLEVGVQILIVAMDSGSYFTSLVETDVEDSQNLTPPSQTTNGRAPAAAKGSQGRSNNFRDEKDILLVSAWLNVGMDPIQGIDQPLGTYWRRTHEYFNANKKFESDRTQGSLMNSWSGIQHDVNLFCGCLSRIEARNYSGWSVDGKWIDCERRSVKKENSSVQILGFAFLRQLPWLRCWFVVRVEADSSLFV